MPTFLLNKRHRRYLATASIWTARAHDLSAHSPRRYGTVNPEVGGRLDPLAAELRARLRRLASAAARLPDT
ncbi:MAG: hypothetical protein ACE5PT_08680 [Gemmatimonadales bacterium]